MADCRCPDQSKPIIGLSEISENQKEPIMIKRPSEHDDNPTRSGLAAGGGVIAKAFWAMRFAVFADAVATQVLGPNYALLVLKNGSEESFKTTDPFGFSAASYFIPLAMNLGLVVSSLLFGWLSDQIGRKACVLTCCYAGAVGTLLKYWARDNYWFFCAATFATGIFNGSSAVGMAYASDMTKDRQKTDAEIGFIVATNMVGRTGGGLIAIAMENVGLFSPLWASAALSALAGIVCHIWLVSPPQEEPQDDTASSSSEDDGVDSGGAAGTFAIDTSKPLSPTVLDKKALWMVVAGELTDNMGSLGLVPLCLNPLMFQTFFGNFVEAGADPLMSSTSYKYIYVFVAVAVVPGAVLAPYLFKKFGPALSAVLANLMTGAVTVALLQIASLEPTYSLYVVFVVVLYCGFPLTVISQVSTGPMLDRISPASQRGHIQGINMATMNIAIAICPFLYGLLTDITSIAVCLYTATGVSIVAGMTNGLLIGDPRFGPETVDKRNEGGDDARMVFNDYSPEIEV